MHPRQQRTDKYYTHADIILELHHWPLYVLLLNFLRFSQITDSDIDIINLDGNCEYVTRPTHPLNLRLTSSPAPTGDWAAALTKAKAAVAKMSTQDKVNLATGIGWMVGACVGNIAAIPSISCEHYRATHRHPSNVLQFLVYVWRTAHLAFAMQTLVRSQSI